MRASFAVLAIALAAVSAVPASAQLSTIRVTEAMSSSGVGGTADWWEITNFGSSAVDITGWKFDDSSFTFGNAVALIGVSSIAAGESVVFVETAAPLTDLVGFRAFWGGSATTAQIGSYSGSGVSLSSAGDGVVIFNASGSEVTPRVTFGAATTGSSFYYQYDAAGDPTTSPNTNAIVSAVGTVSGQVTYLSASSGPQNVGSPGTAINAVPEPSSVAFVACGVLAVAARCRHRRQG